MDANEKIAQILRTDKDYVRIAVDRLAAVVGHNDALGRIVSENERVMRDRLTTLEVTDGSADEIFRALGRKIEHDDRAIRELFKSPTCEDEKGCKTLLNFASELAAVGKGYFLKKEKAREFLLREPPENILSFFKLANVEQLLARFDLFEVYSALRFMEDRTWLNTVFFKQLEGVSPDDFEERPIEMHVLHGEWLRAAETFLKKKYHNVSHLKELGIIFVIPIKIDSPGEIMRLFTLLLHYLHEVDFYAKLFRHYATHERESYAHEVISALRGDVSDTRFAEEDRGMKWMIVQRYLAKEDAHDWRLFEPHVNPEALHWSKAEGDMARLSERFPQLGLQFWSHLDHVGDYFPDASGVEVLVSFNLIDTVMSLVQKKAMIKHLYHHQEALWNRIFREYLGRERMEELIIQNFNKGFIDISKLTA